MATKSVAGARIVSLQGAIKEGLPYTKYGDWQESDDFEITSDPETDREAWGEGVTQLPALPEQGEVTLTRTFRIDNERNDVAVYRQLVALQKVGGGYFEIADQYLDPATSVAWDSAIIIKAQLVGITRSGHNVNEPNGKATLTATFRTHGLPVAAPAAAPGAA